MKTKLNSVVVFRLCVLNLMYVFVVALGVVGCATSSTSSSSSIHPGAANAIDSQIYDTLVSVQASIEQAKIDFGSNPAAKEPLNKIIVSYNTIQNAYKSYHQLAVAGHAPDATSLTLQVSTLVKNVAELQAQFGKKKGGGL